MFVFFFLNFLKVFFYFTCANPLSQGYTVSQFQGLFFFFFLQSMILNCFKKKLRIGHNSKGDSVTNLKQHCIHPPVHKSDTTEKSQTTQNCTFMNAARQSVVLGNFKHEKSKLDLIIKFKHLIFLGFPCKKDYFNLYSMTYVKLFLMHMNGQDKTRL